MINDNLRKFEDCHVLLPKILLQLKNDGRNKFLWRSSAKKKFEKERDIIISGISEKQTSTFIV